MPQIIGRAKAISAGTDGSASSCAGASPGMHLTPAGRPHPLYWQELRAAYYPICRRELKQMQYKRISADCHLDMIWLPPDLFTSQAPRELKERMPFVSDGPNGKEWVARNGASFGLVAGVGSAGRK